MEARTLQLQGAEADDAGNRDRRLAAPPCGRVRVPKPGGTAGVPRRDCLPDRDSRSDSSARHACPRLRRPCPPSRAPRPPGPSRTRATLPSHLKPSLSPTQPASILARLSHIAPPPPSDLVALAKRFRPGQDARLADPPALGPADVGRQEDFWIIDLSRQRVDEVSATLQIVTPHALWYTVGQLNAPRSQLETLAAVFEGHVFPKVAQATLGYVPQQTSGASGAPITMLITP